MKIYKIIVDKKPKECRCCPLNNLTVKIEAVFCGTSIFKAGVGTGWKFSIIPDERCLLEERQG